MFNDSKYTKWYFSIIKNSKPIGYTEKHHIIPKSLGGSNKKENLIKLSAREHYIVHLLLMKMCVNKRDREKMAAAYQHMSKTRNSSTKQRYNSRLYDYHKKIRIKILTEQMSGSGNPMFGKTHSENTRRKISDARIGVNTNTPEALEKRRQKWLTNNPNYDPIAKKKASEKISKNFKVIDPEGKEYIIKNLKQFCTEHNLHNGNMCSVAKGKLKHYKQWKCQEL